jgi:hypothetical protein
MATIEVALWIFLRDVYRAKESGLVDRGEDRLREPVRRLEW